MPKPIEAYLHTPVTTYLAEGAYVSAHPTRVVSDPASTSPWLIDVGDRSLWLIKNEKLGPGHSVTHFELECLTHPGKGEARTITVAEAAAFVRARLA